MVKKNVENINLKNHVVEYLGTEKSQIYRSFKCSRTLPFLYIGDSCRFCSKFKKCPSQNMSVPHTKKQFQSISSNSNSVYKETTSNTIQQSNDSNNVVLKQSNNDDMKKILEEVLPQASGEMLDLLVDQKKNLAKNPNGRRWDKKTISLCLSLWCRSKKNMLYFRTAKY